MDMLLHVRSSVVALSWNRREFRLWGSFNYVSISPSKLLQGSNSYNAVP